MRHRKAGRKLGVDATHRKAMLRNMASSLIDHETIHTTHARAKELRRYSERLVTLAKTDSVANRRLAVRRLRTRATVQKLFNELGPRFSETPGGYTKIVKIGPRRGDAAPMVLIRFLTPDEIKAAGKGKKKKKKKAAAPQAEPKQSPPAAEEQPAEESAEAAADEPAGDAPEAAAEETPAEESAPADEGAPEDESEKKE